MYMVKSPLFTCLINNTPHTIFRQHLLITLMLINSKEYSFLAIVGVEQESKETKL